MYDFVKDEIRSILEYVLVLFVRLIFIFIEMLGLYVRFLFLIKMNIYFVV